MWIIEKELSNYKIIKQNLMYKIFNLVEKNALPLKNEQKPIEKLYL